MCVYRKVEDELPVCLNWYSQLYSKKEIKTLQLRLNTYDSSIYFSFRNFIP